MSDMLIKNGKICLAGGIIEKDLYIKDGKVDRVGGTATSADEIIDASGKLIIPGLIDSHTHMDFPFMSEVTADDFYYGTEAALGGGVTTIIDFITPAKGEDPVSAYEKWRKKADNKVVSDYALHCILRDDNSNSIDAIKELVKKGVISFKLYMAYKNEFLLNDESLYNAIKAITENHGIVAIHAENGAIVDKITEELLKENKTQPIYHYYSRPEIVEIEAANRVAAIASMIGKKVKMYMVHTSTAEAVDIFRKYREQGFKFYNETTPNYLTYDNSVYRGEFGYRYIMSPPFRKESEIKDLWERMSLGDIKLIGSDHCTYSDSQKMRHGDTVPPFNSVPNGTPGVETILPLLFTNGVLKGKLTIEQLVDITSRQSALLFGLQKKGNLLPGFDADVAIIDPKKEFKVTSSMLHSNIDYSIFDGMMLKGFPDMTIVRGMKAMENGDILLKPGDGKYIPGQIIAEESGN
ncbi:MAG: dihydropyrimidinase [Ferroplasma sp.]